FVYENYPVEKRDNPLKVEFRYAVEKLDYPLSIIAYELPKQVVLKINYAGEIIEGSKIKQLLSLIENILLQIEEDINKKVRELSYLTEKDRYRITTVWNETGLDYEREKTIYELFEEQVEKSPDAIAVVYEDKQLTYKELNERANQLAHYIRSEYGIKADDCVALCLDRSEHMLVAILGILKAGGAYVPIDPSYPGERIGYILGDIKPKVLLLNRGYEEKLRSLTLVPCVAVEKVDFLTEPVTNLESKINSSNLAYVIYTSGTTGNPKGVMIGHQSVVNYLHNLVAHKLIGTQSIVDYSTHIGFDLSVTTTIASLCLGAKLEVFSQHLGEVDAYKAYLKERGIEVIKQVPSYFSLITEFLPQTNLKTIIVG
ncbi:MAG: hypothetical protein EB127_30715, partial [Alphaproteobacteria bacterium]|nr:hypothetical protein [Alphaproteobacteria bacterium]